MLSTYTDAITVTVHVLVAAAGVLTVLGPLALAAAALRTPARRLGWRIDAWRYRRNRA